MRYSSVVFDMDGVLLDFRGDDFSWKYEAIREGLRELDVDLSGLNEVQMEKLLGTFGEDDYQEQVEKLGVDPRTSWEKMAAKTSEARIRMIRNGSFHLFDEARETMNRLREEGIRLGIISNAPGPSVEATVKEYDLKRLVDFYRGVETWEDFHHRKPHPELLELAKAELKSNPFLYVGDHRSDVEAAENANMDSVWVNRNGDSMDVEHDYEIEKLDELRDIVSSKPGSGS